MRALAASILLLSSIAVAHAQDAGGDDFQPDYAAAIAAGYQMLTFSTYGVDDATSRRLNDGIVRRWMQERAPGEDYSITYSTLDFSGDGKPDYVVQVHTSADLVDEGSPFLAIYSVDGLELGFWSGAYDVAAKPVAGGEQQLAFIDAVGFHRNGE